MRTTLTIDEDIAAQVEDLRRREGISLKVAINRLFRKGIHAESLPLPSKEFREMPIHLGKLRSGYDETKLNQAAEHDPIESWT